MTGCSVTFVDGTELFDEADKAYVCFDADGHPDKMLLIVEKMKQLLEDVDPTWKYLLEHPYKFAALFVHAAYLVIGDEDFYPWPMICEPIYNWEGNEYEYVFEWNDARWILREGKKVLATIPFYGD